MEKSSILSEIIRLLLVPKNDRHPIRDNYNLWVDENRFVFAKYSPLVSALCMAVLIPFDILMFEDWQYIARWRMVFIIFFVLISLLSVIPISVESESKNGKRNKTILKSIQIFSICAPLIMINLLYIQFLNGIQDNYSTVLLGNFLVIFFTTFLIHRFWIEQYILTGFSLIAILLALFVNYISTNDLLVLIITHSITFIFAYVFRRSFAYELYISKMRERKLEQLNVQNSNLISILHHDIANPLMVVSGNAKTLSMKLSSNDESLYKYVERIEKACSVMNNIIRNVRQMMAVQSGKIEVKNKPTSVTGLYENAKFIFNDKLEQKKLQLIWNNKNKTSDIKVLAEETLLSNQVINNIISNAIKFSKPDGEIYFEVNERDDWVIISIRDNGIGIPDHLKSIIFDYNRQTTRKGTEGEAGTGFGMPLAKVCMDSFGGKIELNSTTKNESDGGHGTTFYLYLKKAPQWGQS